jgi:RHS repeat-associated protein
LLTVTQGAQTRTFVYDSLKRLTSATNPESGTVTYPLYDGNGNLLQKTDARNITTKYAYDVLNRVTSRSYQNDTSGTPAVAYFYDNQTLPTGSPSFTRGSSTGRLVAVTYGNGAAGSYQGYDTFGRATVSYQQTVAQGAMQSYQMGYGYDLSGAMTSETFPSGKIVNTTYDAAGRVTTVSKQGGGNYASGITYAPQGAMASMTLGNNLIEQTIFNSRLQPTTIELGVSTSNPQSVLGLVYSYNTQNQHDNNGNVLSQAINAGSTQIGSQTYTYDGVNRLQTVTEGSAWNQRYDYDQFGNRAVRNTSYLPNSQLTPQSASATDFSEFDQTKNQIKSTLGFQYDSAGNLTADPTSASMVYDAENRQTSYTKSGSTVYAYDGEGHRVTKTAGSTTTVFVYNVGGQLIAEYGGSGTNGGTSYLTTDHLASTRVVTNSARVVIARHDYLPFGEEIPAGTGSNRTAGLGYVTTDDTTQRFTSKEEDPESNLYYFGVRYFSAQCGRFSCTDPRTVTKESLVNPQRWNLYVYVNNNPLAALDPNGGDGEGKGGDKVITVFIELAVTTSRNTVGGVPKGDPGWGKLGGNGYKVNVVFTDSNHIETTKNNTAQTLDALKNPDPSALVVFVAHGVGVDDTQGNFRQTSMDIGTVEFNTYGYTGGYNPKLGSEFDKLPVAEVGVGTVASFSCDSQDATRQYFNFTGTDQQLVTVYSGWDGVTASGTLESAALAFTKTFIATNGDVDKSVAAANAVIKADANLEVGGKKINIGDKVKVSAVR